jgi:predicted N-acyltransferase
LNPGEPDIRFERRISRIDESDWAQLSEAQLYASYGWLQVVEETIRGGASPRYFLLYRDGRLLAAAICYEIRSAGESHVVDSLVFGRLTRVFNRAGLSICPALLCGPLVGHGSYVLWNPSIAEPDRARMLSQLVGELRDYASAQRLSLLFTKLPPDEARILEPALGDGTYRSLNLPVSYIDIEWDSFSNYLAGLSASGKNMPTKVRREVKAATKTQMQCVSPGDVRNDWRTIQGLWQQTHERHTWAPSSYKADFLASLARFCPDVSILNLARMNDSLLGAALLLRSGTSAAGPAIGISDDEHARKSFIYFSLAIYEPVRFAVENGLRRVYLGASSYELKRRRGCREVNLSMYIWTGSRIGRLFIRAWCRIHRVWTERNLRQNGISVD